MRKKKMGIYLVTINLRGIDCEWPRLCKSSKGQSNNYGEDGLHFWSRERQGETTRGVKDGVKDEG